MFKRLVAVFLCLALLVSAIPCASSAAETEESRIRTQIQRVYRRVLYATGRSSLNGYCGLMSSYQLWALGITPYPVTYDGNNMYDYYAKGEPVVNGYTVQAYPVSEYSLEEALNLISYCGTRNVYNILVGFQRTNTTAGRRYGHAMVIHAILDGTVYFVEGFHTSIGGAEGNVLTCSIKEFADFYNPWTTYEGLVVFGNKAYTDGCQDYATDLFATANGMVNLLSLPCIPGTNSCRVVRQTVAGEKLRINGVYCAEGQLYYRVQEGQDTCYIPVEDVTAFSADSGAIRIDDAVVPQQLQPNETLAVRGTVYSEAGIMQALGVTVVNGQGEIVHATEMAVSGRMADLSVVNEALAKTKLANGNYTVVISAKVENAYPENGQVKLHTDKVCIWESSLMVGRSEAQNTDSASKDGWVWQDGCWYFYQNGKPRTGWYTYEGVDYYFMPNGAAATGWHEINGRWRCFTSGGAMRTGWIHTEEGSCFMLSNGVAAMGWRQIEGALYCFDENGLMITQGQMVYGGVTYTFMENGVAVAG